MLFRSRLAFQKASYDEFGDGEEATKLINYRLTRPSDSQRVRRLEWMLCGSQIKELREELRTFWRSHFLMSIKYLLVLRLTLALTLNDLRPACTDALITPATSVTILSLLQRARATHTAFSQLTLTQSNMRQFNPLPGLNQLQWKSTQTSL